MENHPSASSEDVVLTIGGKPWMIHNAQPRIHYMDLTLLVGASVLLFLFMFTGKKRSLDRWEGALFLYYTLVLSGIKLRLYKGKPGGSTYCKY
jgi:hypothetical protein